MENPTAPQIRRRKQTRLKKWVFLPPELWKELDFVAEFATKAFKLTGKPETVSRNDWIEDGLLWALAAYWKEKGGKPASKKSPEYDARAKAFAEKLKADAKREDEARARAEAE